MKRLLFFLWILFGTTIVAFTGEGMGKTAADYGAESVLIIHYHRYDSNYEGWNLWVWPNEPKSMDGKSYSFEQEDEFGLKAIVKFSTFHSRLGFIVRLRDWQAKDVNEDRYVDIPKSGLAEIWVIEGEREYVTDPAEIDLNPRVKVAFLDSLTEVFITLSNPLNTKLSTVKLKLEGDYLQIGSIEKADPTDLSLTNYIKVTLKEPLSVEEVSKNLSVEVDGFLPCPVTIRKALDDPQFFYDGDLGAICSQTETTFRVWSPVSSSAVLLLYEDYDSEYFTEIPMCKGDSGVWEISLEGDFHLRAYKYRFRSYGKVRETVDIYSRAVTKNSLRSVAVDPERIDFPGWESDEKPLLEKPEDCVIYETHVGDITADSNTDVLYKGKYLGLTETGRTGPGGVKVGLDHIVELGVTHVHFLPFSDIYYIDEGVEGQYGWGYDPYLYMVPEGHYSTDPDDPLARIVQAKKMIKALHEKGLSVVLDTVYNHTATTGETSPFDQTVPQYYYRTDRTGAYTNGSGVGNELATERPMLRKHIIDSLELWVEDYHIDGFRFDLLGLFDRETVLEIDKRLHALDESILLYGEPWGGWEANVTFGKGDQRGTGMALFNDNLRDAIRGNVFDPKVKGFVLGSRAKERRIMRGVCGSIDYSYDIKDFAADPGESVNYASAHDNQTLWDKNRAAMPEASIELLTRAQKLSNAIVLLSQGIPFLHGGVEFARTKNGNTDSYNAGVELNKMDYSRKAEFIELFNYYRALIALRRAHPAFRMGTAQEIRENLVFLDAPRNIVAFILAGKNVGDSWEEILVIFNGDLEDSKITLPDTEWKLVADGERISAGKVLEEWVGEVTLEAVTAYVLYK